MDTKTFFCPVYEGAINDYDCAEISTGIHLGYYLDDGLPFLMDLTTAEKRKHRCHACPRCVRHYRPNGIQLVDAMRHLGFPPETAALEEALEKLDGLPSFSTVSGGVPRVRCYQLASGIQIYQELHPKQQTVYDTQPHFFSANAMYLHVIRAHNPDKAGKLVRNMFVARATRQEESDSQLVINAFSSPNLGMFKPSRDEGKFLVAQVTAFPVKLKHFADTETYCAQQETDLNVESFVSGMTRPGADDNNPSADALLTGKVEHVRRVTNELTDLPFYHMMLMCLGLPFDVVAAEDMFDTPPVPGNILQGIFQLSARVIEYGWTGYHFEIDVSLPLTTERFAPIGLAVRNLQPGERLYMGIDPPLDHIVFVRAKGEVEGVSVEFRMDYPELSVLPDTAPIRILRFYPVSKEVAHRIFEETAVNLNPPSLEDARDVTNEYTDRGEVGRNADLDEKAEANG